MASLCDVAVAVVHGDGRAAGAERKGDGAADPARGAGDQNRAGAVAHPLPRTLSESASGKPSRRYASSTVLQT